MQAKHRTEVCITKLVSIQHHSKPTITTPVVLYTQTVSTLQHCRTHTTTLHYLIFKRHYISGTIYITGAETLITPSTLRPDLAIRKQMY